MYPRDTRGPESHQRSWWIVHIQPTKKGRTRAVQNPTNGVGGSFILSLQKGPTRAVQNPTNGVGRIPLENASLMLSRTHGDQIN